MKKTRRGVLVASSLMACVAVGVSGCKSEDKAANGTNASTEHPKASEHPKTSEHPNTAEHPKTGEHPKSAEHPG